MLSDVPTLQQLPHPTLGAIPTPIGPRMASEPALSPQGVGYGVKGMVGWCGHWVGWLVGVGW